LDVLALVGNEQVHLLADVGKDFAEGAKSLVKRRCLIFFTTICIRSVFVKFCDTALQEGTQHSRSHWILDICEEANM
jgi:hypothetical protein